MFKTSSSRAAPEPVAAARCQTKKPEVRTDEIKRAC